MENAFELPKLDTGARPPLPPPSRRAFMIHCEHRVSEDPQCAEFNETPSEYTVRSRVYD